MRTFARRSNIALGIIGVLLIAWNAQLSWQQWVVRPVPWMAPSVLVEVVDGEPLVSFTGDVLRVAIGAAYTSKVEAVGVNLPVCEGGGTANYQLTETRPTRKSLEWWVTPYRPGQCDKNIQPGVRYRLITSWCNAQGECHEATAVWKQPG